MVAGDVGSYEMQLTLLNSKLPNGIRRSFCNTKFSLTIVFMLQMKANMCDDELTVKFEKNAFGYKLKTDV